MKSPIPGRPGRGRPPKKGAAVRLKELFISHKEQFQDAEIGLYGKKESVRCCCIDLLWGRKLYQELRFVLGPLSIIRLYSYRFRVECTFRELKQQAGAFCYHFWSKHMPKLNYYLKKGEPTPLEQAENEYARRKVLDAVRAIEMHMVLSCMAMGILRSLSIRFIGEVASSQIRYQRTPSKGRVSEAALMHYFRKYFFRLLEQKPKSCITQIIHELQAESEEQWDFLAS